MEKSIVVLKNAGLESEIAPYLQKYIAKVFEEYKQRREHHIQIILEQMLDRVFQYEELVMVLGLIGNMYYQLARTTKLVSKVLSDTAYVADINTNF